MAADSVFLRDLAPRGRFTFTDGPQLAWAAGMESAARRRIECARDGTRQPDVGPPHRRVRNGHRGQQSLRIGVIGGRKQRLGGTDLADSSQVHHRHGVAKLVDHTQVMGNEQHRGLETLLKLQQQIHHRCLNGDVQRGQRFIAKNERRPAGERPGERHALLLAAAQLPGQAVEIRFPQPHRLQKAYDFIPDFSAGDGAEQLQGTRNGLSDGALGVQRGVGVLEDHLQLFEQLDGTLFDNPGDIHTDKVHCPGIGRLQARDALGQRALAASGFAHDADSGGFPRHESDIVHGLHQALCPPAVQPRETCVQRVVVNPQSFDLQDRTFSPGGRLGVGRNGSRDCRIGRVRAPGKETAHEILFTKSHEFGMLQAAPLAGAIAPWLEDASWRRFVERRDFSPDRLKNSWLPAAADPRNAPQERSRIRMLGIPKDIPNGTLLDQLARVHDGHPVRHPADDAEVVADKEDRDAELALQLVDEVQYPRLDRDIQTGGRFVHDQKCRIRQQGHGNHDTLQLPARQLVAVALHDRGWVRHVHTVQHADALGPGCIAARRLVLHQHLGELYANAERGVQRRHGILVHHGYLVAADPVQLPPALLHHVLAAKQDSSACHFSVPGDVVHDCKGERALAATRLPDQPYGVAGPDLERDIPDGFRGSQSRGVGDLQVLHFQNGHLSRLLHVARSLNCITRRTAA